MWWYVSTRHGTHRKAKHIKHALHSSGSHVPCPAWSPRTGRRVRMSRISVSEKDVDLLSEISKCKSSLAQKTWEVTPNFHSFKTTSQYPELQEHQELEILKVFRVSSDFECLDITGPFPCWGWSIAHWCHKTTLLVPYDASNYLL